MAFQRIKVSEIRNRKKFAIKKIVLPGDSIRMGYDSFVQEKLAGRAEVFFAEDNGSIAPKQIIHASPNIAPDRGDFRIKKR